MSVRRLVLIAGPAASGKSALMKRLRGGAEEALCRRLKLGDLRSWSYIVASEGFSAAIKQAEDLIVHYDLMRPHVMRQHRARQ